MKDGEVSGKHGAREIRTKVKNVIDQHQRKAGTCCSRGSLLLITDGKIETKKRDKEREETSTAAKRKNGDNYREE